MIDRKLGKRPQKAHPHTLEFARYLTAELPPPPDFVDYGAMVESWPMYLNDTIGDCTCAAPPHMIQAWTSAVGDGPTVTLADQDVLTAYEAVGGYVPGDPSTDNGAAETDVLAYWRDTGIGGHKIIAWGSIDPKNSEHAKQGIDLAGGLYIGVQLPTAWQGATAWDVGHGPDFHPGSWGGHAVCVAAFDSATVTVVSWGQRIKMTWAAFAKYVDEVYLVLTQDWIDVTTQQSPVGLDLAQLKSDISALQVQ